MSSYLIDKKFDNYKQLSDTFIFMHFLDRINKEFAFEQVDEFFSDSLLFTLKKPVWMLTFWTVSNAGVNNLGGKCTQQFPADFCCSQLLIYMSPIY